MGSESLETWPCTPGRDGPEKDPHALSPILRSVNGSFQGASIRGPFKGFFKGPLRGLGCLCDPTSQHPHFARSFGQKYEVLRSERQLHSRA